MQCSVCGELDLPVEGQPADACAASAQYAACAQHSCITVCYLPGLDLEPLVLSSSCLPCAALHIQQCGIRQLGLSRSRAPSLPHTQQQTLLAAATPSGVLLWILEDAYAAAADNQVVPAPLRLLDAEQSGRSLALTVSAGGSGASSSEAALLAVGCGCLVLVWDLRQLEVAYRLEGHTATISALAFSPCHQHVLVTAAEDRMFKVWDLQAGQMLYQSSILGASVPTCLAVDAAAARLAMGCADGSVRQFDLAQLPACREMQVLDLSKAVQQIAAAAATAAAAAERSRASGPKTITAASAGGVQSLRQQMQELISISGTAGGAGSNPASAAELLPDAQAAGSGCVLGMQFVQLSGLLGSCDAADTYPSQYNNSSQQHGLLQELLQPPPQLLVCTQRGLLLVNVASGDVERCCLFGVEASRVWDVLRDAQAAKGCLNNSSSQRPSPSASHTAVPVSQLQRPSAQNQQLQARLAACFSGLPDMEAPAAVCCFAAPGVVQQEQFDPLETLCCLASSSSDSFSMVHISQQDPGRCVASDSVQPSAGSQQQQQQQQQQQLSVFQTRALPEGSPLLDRGARCSSSSSAGSSSRPSSSAGSGLALPRSSSSSSSSSGDVSRSAAAQPDHISSGISSSAPGKQRSTWQADSKVQPTAAAASSRTAGKLAGASRAPASPKPKPKKPLSDKPVTFHRQIKSSGYGFVQPKVKLGQAKPAPVKVGGPSPSRVPQLLAQQLSGQRQYPLDAAAPGEWCRQPEQGLPNSQPVHNGGILRLDYAGDGFRLLTAASDKTARCLWLPLAKHAGAGTTFVGHGAPVSAVSWSHSGELLLTASADRTAKLWNCSNPSAIVTFASEQQQQTSSISRCSSSRGDGRSSSREKPAATLRRSSSSRNASSNGGSSIQRATGSSGSRAVQQGFLSEVTAAQFFYVDQFVLLATGSKLHLYRYKLPEAAAEDDIQRLKASGSYSLAGSYSSSCQTITDVAAANSFLSTLLLLACSNRSIQLVDAATMQVACTIPDAHARPVQRLVQPPASPFVSHPREVHELFASSAPDGVVKLWDVRSGSSSCVRSFTGHKNSQMPISLAFSPCMRYLATGSEDKAAYVYDLRSCSMLGRLRPPGHHAEVVTDVAFHPWRAELMVGCMDGRVHCYADVF